jgi:aminoglycoside phosphotransferase (APT) family kinase protein
MTGELAPELRGWVEECTGARIGSVEPIGSGASRQIWAVTFAGGDQAVVRVDTGDGPVAGTPLTLAREADAYGALGGTDVPVPALRAVHPEGTALLLDRATGTERLDELDAGGRQAVAADYGACLGRLHRLEVAGLSLGSLASPVGGDPTVADLELWRSIADDRAGPAASPAVAIALDQLAATVPAPAPSPPSLCHGDAGPGNFLHDGARVTALLDWEFAHVGDPHDDLAWVVVRNQLLGRPLVPAEVATAWQAATGRSIEPVRVEWFRALVLTRMLISCDASIAWAGPESPSAQVQVALQPFLAAAVFEALRRAGCPAVGVGSTEAEALAVWESSPIVDLLGPARALDDLGGIL